MSAIQKYTGMSDWSHLLSDWGGQPGFWSYLDVSLQPHGRKIVLNWKFQLEEVAAEVSDWSRR